MVEALRNHGRNIKHQWGEQIDHKTDLKLYNREERQRTLKKEHNHWI